MENIISRQYMALATRWSNYFSKNPFTRTRVLLTLLSAGVLILFLILVSGMIYFTFIERISRSEIINYPQTTISPSTERETSSPKDQIHEAEELLFQSILFIDILIFLLLLYPLYFGIGVALKPLERITNKQKQLIADTSHELRTPLALMLSSIEAAILSEKNATTKIFLETQKQDILYLKKLTDDLILTEQTNNHISIDNFIRIDLKEIVEDAITISYNYAKAKNITITQKSTYKNTCIILGSPLHLKRLLLNLIKNAVDYSPNNKTITISTTSERDSVTLEVTDQGVGMNPEELTHITERFYKTDSSRGNSGSGLGLSIVKAIIDSHDAKLVINSNKNKGTTVRCVFKKA